MGAHYPVDEKATDKELSLLASKELQSRADSLEIQLEELLRLVGMSRREWDFNRHRLEAKAPIEFLRERITLMDVGF